MVAINHALTGAIIGLVAGNPFIAVPAAVASHFVCDSLPHFDPAMPTERWLKTKTFRNMLIIDASLCVALVIVLALTRPEHWFLAAVCAFAATSPDFLWLNQFIKTRRHEIWRPNLFSRFSSAIQWFTAPIGAAVELTWAISAIILLMPFID